MEEQALVDLSNVLVASEEGKPKAEDEALVVKFFEGSPFFFILSQTGLDLTSLFSGVFPERKSRLQELIASPLTVGWEVLHLGTTALEVRLFSL